MHDVFESRLQALASHDEVDQREVSLSASVAGRKLAQAIEALDPRLRWCSTGSWAFTLRALT
jgi:hypothetical protein